MEINKIYCGDCLELIKKIDDNSIDLVVTSPPYDNLRKYNTYNFKFEDIARELFRIIKNGGVIVWVVGDATINGSETGTSFKQALYFKEIGFNLHDTMIYEKSGMSFPSSNRYYQIFEYMFILSKGKPKTVNLIADKPNKWAGTSTFGNPSNRMADGSIKMCKKRIVGDCSIRYNIWRYSRGGGFGQSDDIAYQHPATFPEKLAEDHILSWSNEKDLILDIMCGSGTTCKMALKNNRNFIGFEISQEYVNIANKRLEQTKLT